MPGSAAPYGGWRSPISARLIAEGAVRLVQPQQTEDAIYWLEQRPAEEGRYAIVRRSRDGERSDAIPRSFNARTRVHEYGGGAYLASGSTLFFSDFGDQRIYRCDSGGDPTAITAQPST